MKTYNYDINSDMIRGFECLEDYWASKTLSQEQKYKLQLMMGVMKALKYIYAPVKRAFFGKPDLTISNSEADESALKVLGNRTKESHGDYYLSATEIAEFEETGLLGPFDLISPDEAKSLRNYVYDLHSKNFNNQIIFGNEQIRNILEKYQMWNLNYSGIYQALKYPQLWDILSSKAIVQRIASLLGNDVLCWRSQFFEKSPGATGTFWHQTGTFRESSTKAKLKPTTKKHNGMIQLTAWIALTDVTVKNGCMRILPSSYRNGLFERMLYNLKDQGLDYFLTLKNNEIEKVIKTLKLTSGNFLKAQLGYDLIIKEIPDLFDGYQVRDLEMKAGQFVIFTSLNTHASYPNITTDETRLALGGRYTSNDVKIYDGFTQDVFPTPEGDIPFPINNLQCMQVFGEDKFGFNNIAEYPAVPDALKSISKH